jgi:hypothetical protein
MVESTGEGPKAPKKAGSAVTLALASESVVLRLSAGHDNSGNPRRLYVVMHPIRGILVAIDEGYSGEGAIEEAYGPAIYAALSKHLVGTIDTTPAQYRQLLKAKRP